MQEGCVKELAWHTCSHSSSSGGGGSSDISSTHSLIGSGMITLRCAYAMIIFCQIEALLQRVRQVH